MDIRIADLHFQYPGGVQAIDGVTLNIEAGEQVAVVGQNGAGKTTLVKHLNGLLLPSTGSVSIGEWDTRQHPVAKLASRVGYVFQNPDEQLFSHTVEQEVSFGPRNLGFSESRMKELVRDALALTELADKTQTNPYDLSAAWRKMVALASIISMDTAIVVLDEPTTGQDAANIERIAHVIRELRAKGRTIIAITHDIDFCAENFARVIAMGAGRILLDGPAREVLGQEEVLATTYVDPPQLTRLGLRLGLPDTVISEDGLLGQLSSSRKRS